MGRNRREMMEQRSWKLNGKYWSMMLLFGGLSILFIKNMFESLMYPESFDETGRALLIVFGVASVFYIDFVVFGLSHYIANRGQAFQLTREGIANTFQMEGAWLLCFWYKINLIPWEAVRSVYRDEGFYKLHLDVSKVKAGRFAKRHLASDGYAFAYNWISPKMTKEDMEKYIIPYLHVNVNLKKGNWKDKEFGNGPRI